MGLPVSGCWWLGLLFLLSVAVGQSSSSYNAYNYDLTTPQFTPDGRLLQVEYASRASDWSQPLVVYCGNDYTVLMTRKSSSKAQDRLIVMGEGRRNVVVAMSGVLSDSLALLTHVQREMENELRLYGKAATFSSRKIATIVGDACQMHAFGGGIRPYGSNMVVASPLQGIYQTDPSGSVKKCDSSLLVVGGGDTRQAQVKREIQKKLRGNDLDIQETLQRLASILLNQDDKSDGDDKDAKNRWLEVAVLSSTHGVHRLTGDQVQALLDTL